MTDRIKKGEVTIAYCPMQDMLGDFLRNLCREHSLYECEPKSYICPAVHRSVLEQRTKMDGLKEKMQSSKSMGEANLKTAKLGTRLIFF